LLDRIDIHIDVPAVKFKELTGEPPPDAESSANIRERVIHARAAQQKRFAGEKIYSNAAMTSRMIRRYCKIDPESEQMLERAMTRLGLSARAYDRILKVSRTIADLEGSDEIRSPHVAEAVGYRRSTGLTGRDKGSDTAKLLMRLGKSLTFGSNRATTPVKLRITLVEGYAQTSPPNTIWVVERMAGIARLKSAGRVTVVYK
jgi:hypothetical protein